MTAIRAFHGLALVGFVVAAIPAANGAPGPDVLEYRYANGFVASGAFAGDCGLVGIAFAEGEPGQVRLRHQGATLTVEEARLNYTVAGFDDGRVGWRQWHEGRLTATVDPLAPDDLTVTWGATGHARASHVNVPGADPLSATLAGSQWEAGRLARFVRTGPGIFQPTADGAPGYVPYTGIAGWSRALTVDDDAVTASGDVGFLLMEARVEWPGGSVALPPHHQQEARGLDASPAVAERTWIETHAWLRLENATFEVPPSATLYCDALTLEGDGVVTYRDAQGAARVDGRDVSFVRNELTVGGSLASQERLDVEAGPTGEEAWPHGRASGAFTALGLDFETVVAKPTAAPDLARIGFWALLGGLLLAVASQFSRLVGLFYTRLDESNALHHPLRRRILGLVQERPGLIQLDVVAATGQPRGVVRHHTQVLETVGLVRSLRAGKETHLYPRGVNLDQEKRSLVLARDAAARFLVDRVQAGPVARWRAGRDLMDRFGVSRMGAWKMIRRAVAAGLVRAQATSQGEVLQASPGPVAPAA